MEKERDMLRLDIDPLIVGVAKIKFAAREKQLWLVFDEIAQLHNEAATKKVEAEKKVEFRAVLDDAVHRHLAEVDAGLERLGFRPDSDRKPRVWPVSKLAIKELDEVAARHGLARTTLIRVVLTLAAEARQQL